MNGQTPTWKFVYRVYKKQRAIQLKPFHDAQNHVSLVWTKGKSLSAEDFIAVEAEIRAHFESIGWTLTFTILRACTNCTYGRFDQSFEDLILSLRRRYTGIFTGKDLTVEDPKHQELHALVEWSAEKPIVHHVHGRSETGNVELDAQWESLFRGPERAVDISNGHLFGTQVTFEICLGDRLYNSLLAESE